MSAVQAIKAARAAGIELSVDGNKLLIEAASEPPASIIDELRLHKPDIVELLRSEGPLPEIPGIPESHEEARRDRFDERAAILEVDEGLPRAEAEAIAKPREMAADETEQTECDPGPYASALAALGAKCPAFVPEDRWQQAIADATAFTSHWGAQAQAFGWTSRELFVGLHPVPEQPAPNYSRLSRLDHTGMIWLLRGRPVIALTAAEAVLRCLSGATLTYRKLNKPALGPVGDSLDDWGAT
jgi:hypothetical protein